MFSLGPLFGLDHVVHLSTVYRKFARRINTDSRAIPLDVNQLDNDELSTPDVDNDLLVFFS